MGECVMNKKQPIPTDCIINYCNMSDKKSSQLGL